MHRNPGQRQKQPARGPEVEVNRFLESGKGGDKAYVLLRKALEQSGKIAIAKVVIRTRQHLAGVKPQKNGLMLELMHFPEELLDASEFKGPTENPVGKAELQMAKQLIESMSSEWKPEQYKDEYHQALEKMIEQKIRSGGEKSPVTPAKKKQPANIVDLTSVLRQSIQQTQSRLKSGRGSKNNRATSRKRAA